MTYPLGISSGDQTKGTGLPDRAEASEAAAIFVTAMVMRSVTERLAWPVTMSRKWFISLMYPCACLDGNDQ